MLKRCFSSHPCSTTRHPYQVWVSQVFDIQEVEESFLIYIEWSAFHSHLAPTRDPIYPTHQSLRGSSSHSPLPSANGSNGLPLGPTSGMVGADRSKPQPPPSPADTTGESRTHRVLQGTISALKLIQQIVGLAPVPGLDRVVLNISEIVIVSFGVTYICQWHVK